MDKPVIEPLGVDNYATWSIKMKMLLIHKGLWDTVADEATQATPSSLKALALIALCVEDHHLHAVGACQTAHEAWTLLEATYKGKSEARVLQLRRELISLKKGASEPLSVYISRASALAADLTAAGHTVNETEVAYALLSGLPAAYDTAVTVMQMSGQEIRLATLLPRLLPIEQRLKTETADDAAYAVGGRPLARRPPVTPADRLRCYKCLHTGHRVVDCTNKPSPQAKKCKSCGRWGHLASQCHKPAGKPSSSQQVAFAVGDESTKVDWILDSGCTNHMTPLRAKFATYETLSNPVYFTFANGQKAAAVGRGQVQVQADKVAVTLLDVLHVPEASVNLLSVKKVMDSGARVEFSNGRCSVYRGKTLLFTAHSKGGLHYLPDTAGSNTALAAKAPQETAQLWHERFGHLSYGGLTQLVKDKMVQGINIQPEDFERVGQTVCQLCVMAKQARHPFPFSTSTTTRPLQLVHMDVCGPMPVHTVHFPGSIVHFPTTLTSDTVIHCSF